MTKENNNQDELLLESSEFSKGIPLVGNYEKLGTKLWVGDSDIKYYTIKTTGMCDKHGEISLVNTFVFNGVRYCGTCYKEMIETFCKEVK